MLFLLLSVFCLGLCAMTDYKTGYVYDGIVLSGFVFALTYGLWGGGTNKVTDWIVFCILQAILFRRMYGEGDVLVFLLTGTVYFVTGRGICEDLILMLLTILLLGIHQAYKRNINHKGNLKKPVPMVPYIFMAFLLCEIYQ